MITAIRWKLYKALCWLAWHVCPSEQASELSSVWVAGIEQRKRDLRAPLGAINER